MAVELLEAAAQRGDAGAHQSLGEILAADTPDRSADAARAKRHLQVTCFN